MRKWGIAGMALLLSALALAATAVALADESYPYVLYLPMVFGSGNRVIFPADYCEVSYLENAATGNGLLSHCQSVDPEGFIASVSLFLGQCPLPLQSRC